MGLRDKTLLVLGAGASAPYNLPLGGKLVSEIAAAAKIRIDFDRATDQCGDRQFANLFLQAARRQSISPNPILTALAFINSHSGTSASIDDFVHSNTGVPNLPEAAKICITYLIAEHENRSPINFKLERNANEDLKDVVEKNKDSWVHVFYQNMQKGITRNDIANIFDDLYVVNFNYDRCFEQHISLLIRANFGFSEDEMLSVMEKLRMIHPYGCIGRLFGQVGKSPRSFGKLVHDHDVFDRSEGIRTYTEAVDAQISKTINSWFVDARQVVFLGFGFHKQNMDLFGERQPTPEIRIFGTSLDESEPNRRAWTKDIEMRCNKHYANEEVKIEDSNSEEYLRSHRALIFE